MKIFIKKLNLNGKVLNNIRIDKPIIFKINNEEYVFDSNESLKIKNMYIDNYYSKKIFLYKKCLGKYHTKKFLKWLEINGISSLDDIKTIKFNEVKETVPTIRNGYISVPLYIEIYIN